MTPPRPRLSPSPVHRPAFSPAIRPVTRPLTRLVALLTAALVAVGMQVALAPSQASAKIWRVPAPNNALDPLVKLTEYENRIAYLVNKKRKARDLEPVRYFQSCLDGMSERWAGHLADIGKLVHRDQSTVLKRCDLTWTGENLVRGTALLPGDAVKAWMGSKPHRAVLLKARANRVGVGTRIDGDGRLVTVLNFGDVS